MLAVLGNWERVADTEAGKWERGGWGPSVAGHIHYSILFYISFYTILPHFHSLSLFYLILYNFTPHPPTL